MKDGTRAGHHRSPAGTEIVSAAAWRPHTGDCANGSLSPFGRDRSPIGSLRFRQIHAASDADWTLDPLGRIRAVAWTTHRRSKTECFDCVSELRTLPLAHGFGKRRGTVEGYGRSRNSAPEARPQDS